MAIATPEDGKSHRGAPKTGFWKPPEGSWTPGGPYLVAKTARKLTLRRTNPTVEWERSLRGPGQQAFLAHRPGRRWLSGLGRLGPRPLGPSLAAVGRLLGLSGRPGARSWGSVGCSWATPGRATRLLAGSGRVSGGSWATLGALVAARGRLVGHSWRLLGQVKREP